MGNDSLSREAFVHVERTARDEGGATRAAERQHQSGGGLNPLVDPKTKNGLRRSLPRLAQVANGWRLNVGLPMPVKTRFDGTNSMQDNVDIALRVLPDLYDMLTGGQLPALGRYDVQIANAVFNDRKENPVITRSEFEMAIKIAEQLRMLVPVRFGEDDPEDPHYDIFADAFLTHDALSRRWGLLGYDFTVSDAPARDRLELSLVTGIFGDEVFDRIAENGHQIDRHNLPTTEEIVQNHLLKRAHAFFLQVRRDPETSEFWRKVYGRDRVVVLPSTELLPQVQSAIIGLTEGVIDLQSLSGYLTENCGLDDADARDVMRAVSGIPVGKQTLLPNFRDIPKAGDIFRSKEDSWPIGHPKAEPEEGGHPKKRQKVVWA